MPATVNRPPPSPPNRLVVPAAPPVRTWGDILRAAGYPDTVLVLDFETYFDDEYGFQHLSTIEYVNDPRFEVISCGFTHMHPDWDADTYQHQTYVATGDRVESAFGEWKRLYGDDLEGCTVLAQNLGFDATVLSRHFNIHPKYMIDLLGLARHVHPRSRNDLATLCKRYKLTDKGKTENFKGLTLRDRGIKPKGRGPKIPKRAPKATPEQLNALSEYNANDVLREWELFTLLLPQITNPETELRLIQHHIELFTKPTLRVDFGKGESLIKQMEQQMNEAMPAGMTADVISGNLTFEAAMTTALEKAGDTPLKYTKFGKRGAMLALSKTDDSREELLNHPDPGVQALMKARVAVKSWPLHIARVQRIMSQAKADRSNLPVPLKYYGAHTGRASGGEQINLQNLGSRGDPLISAVREMIVAPPHKRLVIVDAAAIEARVLAWVAGQWDLVDKFAAGAEIYCGFASKVLGYPVRKPKKGGIPAIEERMKWARNSVGKIGVLGCGYGMGADKTCAYAKGAITLEIATKIVETYRAENQAIVKFWRDLERAFRYTAAYKKPCAMERGLSFRSTPECDCLIRLPNGRELRYPNVRVTRDDLEVYNSQEHRWERTWGGTLTENVVQAMSRDVLMEAMLRLEDMGYHTAMHVHDELVLVVPDDQAEVCLRDSITELSRTPTWAPRMALSAEGAIGVCYGKH